MSDVQIILSWAEVVQAAIVGIMRNVQSLRAGRQPGNGFGETDTWTANIEGAAGEMALAKYLGVFWSGAIGNLKARDVAGFQVKTNLSRRFDDLIVRETDPDGQPYVLVLSFLPRFVICGWLPSEEAKLEKWFREGQPGRPAYFVPRSVLRPLSELPRGIDDDPTRPRSCKEAAE